MSAARTARLNDLFHDVVKGKKILTPGNARLFLEAICQQKSASQSMSKLVAGSSGLQALEQSLSSDTSLEFIQGPLTKFITHIRAPELQTLCGGDVLRQVCNKVVEAPLVWDAFVSAARTQNLHEPALGAFAWVLTQLLSLPIEDAVSYLPVAQNEAIQKSLLQSNVLEHRIQGQRIVHIAQSLAGSSHSDSQSSTANRPGLGGRHDNDHAEIRNISIYPSSDELRTLDVYLPTQDEIQEHAQASDSLAAHMDGQFRLLREDMLRELREELKAINQPQPQRRPPVTIKGLQLVGAYCDDRKRWSLKLLCGKDIPGMPKTGGNIKQRRKKFLEDNHKFLKNGNLSYLIVDGTVTTLGEIFRQEDLLCEFPPMICIQIPDVDIENTLVRLQNAGDTIGFVQLSTALFSYEPILKQLKETREMLLAPEIISWKTGDAISAPHYKSSAYITSLLDALDAQPDTELQSLLGLPTPTKLDEAQAVCFTSALRQRVTAIQGPPGTGKSFIGALAGKAIFTGSKELIMVVCYTHHALDDYIEGLLDLGIPRDQIVRLGSNQKATTRTKDLALFGQSSKIKFTGPQREMLNFNKAAIPGRGRDLTNTFGDFLKGVTYPELMDYLEFASEDIPFWDAFLIPSTEDGMTTIGKNNKAVAKHYLLQRWINGKDAGIFSEQRHKQYHSVWIMTANQRRIHYSRWAEDINREKAGRILKEGKRYNDAIDRCDSIFLEKDLTVLRNRRIIACTTTAAAKYSELLRSVAPGVLIVEEAGEILESHVLTALGPTTKHLILIGDHLQLRPKCTYELSVEKGTGYDLNRSLFERLILRGFPHQVLYSQHRMRPEISALVRELTYPNLTDAAKTSGRPDLLGFTDNLIFVNHKSAETELPSGRELGDPSATSSKQNPFEAQMTLKVVRYLAQQGYRTDKMVVLTPYLGQLRLLLEELALDNDPVLGDIDSHDLVRAGLIPIATANVNKPRLRISTIDNYQGEEADVVVASLTRSNSRGDIGFMSAPERLNVLLSRARNALILIGDLETFMASRKGGELWTRFAGMMKAKNHIYDGFPVRCERHPARTALLKQPVDFDSQCPNGGCDEACNKMLVCGVHRCPDRCHLIYDHSKIKCQAVILSKCPKGHSLQRKCFQADPKSCRKCETEVKKALKEAERKLKEQEDQQAHLLQMAEIDQELQAIKDQMESTKAQHERQAALEQKRRDLEAAKALATKPKETKGAQQVAKKPNAQISANKTAPATSLSSDQRVTQPEPAKPSEPSPAEVDWERQKAIDGASNAAIDELMGLTGLEAVKEKMLDIKSKIDTISLQGTDVKKERFGVTMLGNPGTGKTTVARIYGKFLSSVNAIPGSEFVEVSGSSLANDGVAGAKQKIEDLSKAGGGIFFLDEAYQLASGNSYSGKAVLDYLLAEIEERRGCIVFILAGYHKEMEAFFEHNPGFPSRVPLQLNFADYSDPELLTMLGSIIEKKYSGRAEVAGGLAGLYLRILVRRLGRRRGTKGYGNARDLENVWSQVTERQAGRHRTEKRAGKAVDALFFSQADIVGPEPSAAIKSSKAWKELNSLVGLQAIKRSVQSFVDRVQLNYKRELEEKSPIAVSLNRLFLGSPGTGKTSVAKLYGAILADIGLLSKGEVLVKTPPDFVGSVLGESEKNTKAILKASEGKVLLIDEAYGLSPASGTIGGSGGSDPYKAAVIDTIVAEVQSVPGEDRCVLMLGYNDQMREMLRNANPGLCRRFPLDSAFQFEDFDDAALREILDFKLKSQELTASNEAKDVAIGLLARARDKPNFGNAGEVENLLSQAKGNWSKRVSLSQAKNEDFTSDVIFAPEDFDTEHDRLHSEEIKVEHLFSDIVGLDKLVTKLQSFQRQALNLKARGKDPRAVIPFNFVFKGPPGTGKTTVARRIAAFYYQIGILPTKEFKECSAADLTAAYVGQSGPKTRETLRSALGQVLFIDEAYRLQDGVYGKEAIDEIVDCLTKPDFLGKLVVIIAGYTDDMNDLLRVNPGLSSRFPEEVFFESMSPERCLELLGRLLQASELDVPGALSDSKCPEYSQLADILTELIELPSWGSGRDITTLSKKITGTAIENADVDSEKIPVSMADIQQALSIMLSEQKARAETRATRFMASNPFAQATQSPVAPIPKISTATITELKNAQQEPTPAETAIQEKDKKDSAILQPPAPARPTRDQGVSDRTWQQLLADTAAYEESQKRAAKEIACQEKAVAQAREQELASEQEIQRLETLVQENHAAEDEKARTDEDDIRRRLEQERIRAVLLKRSKDEELAKWNALHQAEVQRRKEEQHVQKKLQDMGMCVAGFRWIKQADGYRCAGGAHFVDNAALGL